jgi:tripartite-type tricarboxylate transporter receptor subunit TctC
MTLQSVGRAWRWLALALCALAVFGVDASRAQEAYPSRQLTIVVGFPPGGGVDVVARLVADKLAPILGKAVVVENRPGASGSLALRQVAASRPDGHTILMNSNSTLVNQAVNANAGHDIEKELTAVLKAAVQSIILAATPSLEASTLGDVIKLAKTKELDYGSPGTGSVPHLALEYLFSQAGVTLKHIPFPGAAQALTAAVAGHIQLAAVTTPPAVTLVQGGKLKGITVTSAQRSPALPEVSTAVESGFKDFVIDSWAGFFVPSSTPKAVVDALTGAMLKVLAMPEVKEKLVTLGFEPRATTSEAFGREVSAELKQWKDVAAKANIKF